MRCRLMDAVKMSTDPALGKENQLGKAQASWHIGTGGHIIMINHAIGDLG
jgi:hypothetical protein